MHFPLKWLGEPWLFGVPVKPNLRTAVEGWLESAGLRLEAYEPDGSELGGVVLAVPAHPSRPES